MAGLVGPFILTVALATAAAPAESTRGAAQMPAPARQPADSTRRGPATPRDSAAVPGGGTKTNSGAASGASATATAGTGTGKQGASGVTTRSGSPARDSVAPSPPKDGRLPGNLPASLLVAAFCGAIGGVAAMLVTGDGRLARWSQDDKGWSLGFLAQSAVGAVAALIATCVSSPDRSWLTLIGTALTAGVGGQSLLLAMVHGKRAAAAEKDAVHAERQTRRVKEVAAAEFDLLRAASTSRAGNGALAPRRGADPNAIGVVDGAAVVPSDAQFDAAVRAVEAAAQPLRDG